MLRDESLIPFVDKEIVKYLKEVYDTRFLLEICKKEEFEPATSIGFMRGVQYVIDRLDAISTREDE